MSRIGNVTIPADCDIWPHEEKTAKALAAVGHDVAFVRPIEGSRVKTPDVQMDGALWEMKSPQTGNIKSLQRILRRAGAQSPNVIVDSSRMKGASDKAIEAELRRLLPLVKSVKRLVLVNKSREVIDLT